MSGRCMEHLRCVSCRLMSNVHPDRLVGWIARTFVEGEEAETDLSIDRPRFMQRQDIMELIPRNIKKHITHPGDIGQIHGFQELFVYLERSSASEELRRLIVDYFARSPTLRGHLSQSLPTESSSWKSSFSFPLLQKNL